MSRRAVRRSRTTTVLVDHGDAYRRGVQLGVYANYPDTHTAVTTNLKPFDGAVGDNVTGARVTGLIGGSSGVVVIGGAIAQPDAPNGQQGSPDEHPDVFAIAADPATGAHTTTWLTSFPATGDPQAGEPRVVQVAANRWAVLFGVTDPARPHLITS